MCTTASSRGRRGLRDAAAGSCRRHPSAPAPRRLRRCVNLAVARGRETLAGERVKPTSRPVLVCRTLRILPVTPEQAHFFEPSESTVERPVRRQQPPVGDVREVLRDLVAVEFAEAGVLKIDGSRQDRGFEWNQGAGLSSHGGNYKQIYAYYVNRACRLQFQRISDFAGAQYLRTGCVPAVVTRRFSSPSSWHRTRTRAAA